MTDDRVSVVIATRGRPQLLRRAIRSIAAQSIDAEIEIIVVFDQGAIDSLSDAVLPQPGAIKTIKNHRSPGLAGARNSGIQAASHDLIAFCDDDDEWTTDKLKAQLDLLAIDPEAVVVATGIRIESAGGSYDRLPPARTELTDLLESRITELHPSSFLLRRADLIGELGLVDEHIPASYGEDYDLLLRAAKLGHIAAVPTALTVVHWDRTSFFSDRWEGIAGGLTYLLDKHSEFEGSRIGAARIEGQIAFAYAALGNRGLANHWAKRALNHNRRQLRAYAAWLVGARLLSASMVVVLLNRMGRGL